MKYLILGAKGQLGLEWTKYLQSHQIPYLATDRDELDITEQQAVEDCLNQFKPDVVLNCVAYTNVDGAETETDANERLNHTAPGLVAKLCEAHRITFVHYSTDYVFSGKITDKQVYPDGYPVDAPVSPVNQYGAAKLRGEQAVQAAGENHLIIRIAWLCSAYGKNFLKTMLRLGQEKPKLSIVNDQFGSPTFTFDVVDATAAILASGQRGVFHLTSEGMYTWFDFANAIFKASDITVKTEGVDSSAYPMVAKRPAFSKLDNSRFKAVAGGKTYQMEQGIRRVLDELNKQS
ncbi:dTDP-4-dehydrorhamnose reductase [Cyclonatronum proteinivorum]|uniref:dTDP-4-dehydrorhamnose reductase n=1 Tax=Cyclonatronum proteinivorum TaxID=1457365 RepID=A0A345UKM8_9BACT|nr:dTDP-4-dehydrorhamnose reductase [Cyclonatronum proteinivorum]AXJ01030.1 dTDP-4-dehydrorhamnose reductase [Cyclonatronum proteinivorum]